MASSSEIQTQNLLDAVTSGIQTGDDLDEFMERADSPPPEFGELVGTIKALHKALTPVEPRPEFVESLRAESNPRPARGSRARAADAAADIPCRRAGADRGLPALFTAPPFRLRRAASRSAAARMAAALSQNI